MQGAGIRASRRHARLGRVPGESRQRQQTKPDACSPRCAKTLTLIYTSGTTGPPKGVMLSHRNLSWTADLLLDVGGRRSDEVCCRICRCRTSPNKCARSIPATVGSTVYFAESIDKVPDNIKEARPTAFFGVPRIWEKFHSGVAAKLSQATGAKKKLVEGKGESARVSTLIAIAAKRFHACSICNIDSRRSLRHQQDQASTGFDRAQRLYSGVAPIAPDVLEFMSSSRSADSRDLRPVRRLGPDVVQLLVGRTKLGSVDVALPGIEVKIAEDGEICMRGPNVFLGYYKESEATAEALVDGRLRPGDLGIRQGRIPHDHRSQEGVDHHRGRREHRAEKHRAADQELAARRRGGRDRRSPQVTHCADHDRRSRREASRATCARPCK